MKLRKLASRAASVLIAITLSLGFLLVPALAKSYGVSAAFDTGRSEEEIEAAVSSMLSAGEYTEGEAIVCCLSNVSGIRSLTTQSVTTQTDLLSGSEQLSSVTRDQFAEAVDQSIAGSANPNLLHAPNAAQTVDIKLVRVDGMSTEELLTELLRDTRVLSAEPNYIMSFAEEAIETPEIPAADTQTDTDPQTRAVTSDLTSYQWFSAGSENATSQLTNGTNPGINAPNWNTPGTTNSAGVVVILDSGVDYTHPDLQNVMYHFSPELQRELGCGEYGYAPIREDVTDPMDGFGHGTHCAGIVAAEWNGFGVSGIASGIKLVAVSVSASTEDSTFGYDSLIKGYDFIIRAAKAGVDIRSVNRSIDTGPVNTANQAMCIAAGDLGIVTVIASGNVRMDLDAVKTDTGMYQTNPYILRVDAASKQDGYAWFTNYGTYTTDVFAPGVAILSTVPSNQERFSRYFPQADDDPLYLETGFDNGLLDVHGSDLDNPDYTFVTLNKVSKGSVGMDGDRASMALDVTVHGEFGHVFYVDLPVASFDFNDIQDMSVAIFSPDLELHNLSLEVLLDDGSYSSDYLYTGAMESTSAGAPRDWALASFHLYDPSLIEQGIQFVRDSQGRKCIRLAISGSFEKEGGDAGDVIASTIFVDQIAIGKRGNTGFLPYQYMNGTSMAAPVVTAAAAVVSSSITGVSPAQRAATTVNLLKGTVHQTNGYKGLCKQNGQIDLSFLMGSVSYVPVLTDAFTQDGQLILCGTGFDTAGTLTVEGTVCPTVSWANTEIIASWPADVTSGLLHLRVTSDTGAVAQRAFILEAPASDENTQTYERDLAPISVKPGSPSITDVPESMASTSDGILFAAVPDSEDRMEPSVRYLMRSDDQGESWSAIALPQALHNVTIAAGNGDIFVFGSTPADIPVLIETWHLYSYDIAKGTFKHLRSYEHFGQEIENAASIVYAGGHLYCVDSYPDPYDYNAPSHMRVKRFTDDYGLTDTYTFILSHDYTPMGSFYAPRVSSVGNSFYVCSIDTPATDDEIGLTSGLERVDVAADGTLTCTDLSKQIADLGIDRSLVCIAGCEQGVFLIGQGLDSLATEGTPRTDTYFLKKGATEFVPFDKTLSLAPIISPAAVCANGWLYAYGNSQFEASPIFGRATKFAEAKTGWQKEDGSWHFYNDDGTQLKDGWAEWDGTWYYFGADGELQKEGWAGNEGTYYYIKNYVPMKEGWATYKGAYYYIKNYVPMKEGWAIYKGTYYYIRDYSPVVNTWIPYNGSWYHFNGSGACDRVA